MSEYHDFTSAGAEWNESGSSDRKDADDAFVDSLLEFTAYGDGCNAFTEVQQNAEDEWGEEGEEGDVSFNQAFKPIFEQQSDFEDVLATTISFSSSSPTSPALSEAAVSLSDSLDDIGVIILNSKLCASPAPLTTANYAPHPHILAHQPESPPDPSALYAPLTTSHFRTAAEAKAHRRRARIQPKSQAQDIGRVKNFGRDYWVCRIFNAMIYSRDITDGDSSVHRTRFTKRAAFDALDLEATAHHVFDEAIAVHERGWNRPQAYHKNTVRGKLVDVSETSLELRLSRICLVLQQTKSAVDDAVRGGVTLALLCDNPEARRFTKASNDAGNAKRSERLKQTATKERAKKVQQVQEEVTVEVEGRERSGGQEVSKIQDGEE